MTDIRRENTHFKKKVTSYFAAALTEGVEKGDLPIGDGNFLIATLPENSIVTDAYIQVAVVSDAGTTAVATLGTASAGTQILSDADLTTLGKEGTFTGHSLTGSSVDVWLNVAIAGAQTAVGEYIVVVEYLEYTLDNGEYTVIPNV